MKFVILILLLLLNSTNLFCDLSTDVNEYNNITEYKMNFAKYKLKPFIENMSKSQAQKLFGEYLPYDILLGNGQRVKPSYLYKQMGYIELYNDIKMGETFRPLSITLGISIGGAFLVGVIGSSFMVSFKNQNYDFLNSETYKSNFFITGAILLGISALSLIEIIIVSVFLYKASLHHLTESQVKSIINQYNKFLQKKYNVPITPDISYNANQNINLAFSYKF